jgi:hypothetical protein
MSVVKKYQTGGQIGSPEEYESFLAKKLAETRFTSKAQQHAEAAAARFRDLHKSGKLGEAYSFDQIRHEYTVDVNKLPEELRSQE